ncbi:MAG: hypothetical protein IJB86_10980, partial [Clostridia bacterium]|nr:hypothetical protein [Clostridia bacterium]
MKRTLKRTLKKSISLFLAAIMILSIAPTVLFAITPYAADTTYQNGDIIEFGSYPQSKVTDSTLLSALNSKSKTWVSYGYYSGTGSSDGQMTAKDYMKYADVTYNGNKYRAVTFSSYRPYFTSGTSSSGTYQDDNGYTTNTVYWFKYEPLKWRVLDSTGLVICEKIIDSQAYNNYCLNYDNKNGDSYDDYYGNPSKTYYANNYANSSIREWLNDDFYNTAFTTTEKGKIKTTTLDNSAYIDSYSKYGSASTNDKVFLLSCSEALNANYFKNSTAQQASGSDYAKCQGLYVHIVNKRSYWHLRSASDASCFAGSIDYNGYVGDHYGIGYTAGGVRPALTLNLQDICNHSYTSVITKQPTCSEMGIRTYTCSKCSNSYTENIAKKAHTPGTWQNEKSATCTEKGSEVKKCTVCKETVETRETAELGHNYKSSITDATCKAPGKTVYTCSLCQNSYEEIIPQKEHKLKKVTVEATCTEKGSEYNKCELCGDTIGEVTTLPAKGHTEGEWETVSKPTIDADGKKVKKCTVCKEVVKEEVIEKLAVSKDEETGVELGFDKDDYDGEVEITVEEKISGTAFNIVNTQTGAVKSHVFDITMTLNGEKIQPNGKVVIRIPLPEGYDPKRTFVCFVDAEKNTIETIDSEYVNGYFVFETDHFSY